MKGKTVFRGRLAIVLALILMLSPITTAWAQEEDFQDFSELSIEDMLNTKVVSASKVEQSIMEAPNSIWVIKAQDIRQSGARTIPEALKLAPGVYVAQISGNEWVVTIGGFAQNTFSNKLLVLVDGVTVYQTVDGRVTWNQIPVTIDEVERIEVVRGPGGVTYGANAVNGVINIITKSAGNGGAYTVTRVGTQGDRSFAAAADLSLPDRSISSRISASHGEDQGFGVDQGDAIYDGQVINTISSRNKFKLGDNVMISLDGRYSQGELQYPYTDKVNKDLFYLVGDHNNRFEASILSGRIDQHLSNGRQWYLQVFNKRLLTQLSPQNGKVEAEGDSQVSDVEFQGLIPFEALGQQSLIFGGGYRWIYEADEFVEDGEYEYNVANAYVSHEWKISKQWIWNAGVKWEEVSLVDPTWQWRTALIFMPVPEHAFRISAANAYRSPTLTELYNYNVVPAGPLAPFFPPGVPLEFLGVRGNDQLNSEQLVSYELGYRGVWGEKAMVDILYAYRQYENLISFYQISAGQNIAVPFPPFVYGPVGVEWGYNDNGTATSQDIELGVDYRINDQLRLLVNYTYFQVDVSGKDVFAGYEASVPKNFGRIGLNYQSPQGFMMDVSANYADQVNLVRSDDLSAEPYKIEDYWRIDARIAQNIKMKDGDLELGLIGTNLGQEWNEEYMNISSTIGPHSIRRAFYGYVEYRVK